MKIEFDKKYDIVRRTSVYAMELEAIEKVIKGEHQSACFTYEFTKLALNAATSLQKICRDCNLDIRIVRRKNVIYAVRREENGQKDIS